MCKRYKFAWVAASGRHWAYQVRNGRQALVPVGNCAVHGGMVAYGVPGRVGWYVSCSPVVCNLPGVGRKQYMVIVLHKAESVYNRLVWGRVFQMSQNHVRQAPPPTHLHHHHTIQN